MRKRTVTTPTNPEPKRHPNETRVSQAEVNLPIEQPDKQQNPQSRSAFDSIRAIFSAPKSDQTGLNRSMSDLSISTAVSDTSKASTRSNYDGADALGGNRMGLTRNILEIDVLRFDDQPYKSNMTEREVYTHVLRNALGLKRSQINNVMLGWQGHPYIQARLKMDICINDYAGKHEYMLKIMNVDGLESEHKITFEVRGFKPNDPTSSEVKDNWIRWVKIEQTGLDADRARLTNLLSKFGTVLTDINELTIEFKDEVVDSDDDPDELVVLGTGKFEVQIQIVTHIPQYLPAFGRKMKIHYKGIEKQCTNCYGAGHYKANCKEERVEWIEYVCWFRENYPEVGPELLGRWNTLASIHSRKKAQAETAQKTGAVSKSVAVVSGPESAGAASEATTEIANERPEDTTVDLAPEKKTIKRGRRQTKAESSQPTMGNRATTRSRK